MLEYTISVPFCRGCSIVRLIEAIKPSFTGPRPSGGGPASAVHARVQRHRQQPL